MNFSKPHTWLSLPRSIKETVVNGHPDASITNVSRVSSNEHGLVMLPKVTPRATKQSNPSHF